MKKIYFALLLAITSISLNSCQEKENPNVEPTTYTVSFATSGDYSYSQKPMTKGNMTESDLIGIMSYVSSDNGASYSPYKYGVFDDISKASITLLEGKMYKFAAILVRDGKNKIATQYIDNNRYEAPFNSGVGNKFGTNWNAATYGVFVDGVIKYVTYQPSGSHTSDGGNHYLESFVGVVSDVVPSDNMTVNLEMKAQYGGLKVNTIWDDSISGGSIRVSVGSSYFTLAHPNTTFSTPITLGGTSIFNLYDNPNYTQNIQLKVFLIRADGTELPILQSASIPITKKMITTVNLHVSEATTDASITASVEDVQMEDGNVVSIDTSTGTVDVQVGIE